MRSIAGFSVPSISIGRFMLPEGNGVSGCTSITRTVAYSILVCLIITVLIVERIIVRTFTIQATIGEDILISTITLHRTE